MDAQGRPCQVVESQGGVPQLPSLLLRLGTAPSQSAPRWQQPAEHGVCLRVLEDLTPASRSLAKSVAQTSTLTEQLPATKRTSPTMFTCRIGWAGDRRSAARAPTADSSGNGFDGLTTEESNPSGTKFGAQPHPGPTSKLSAGRPYFPPAICRTGLQLAAQFTRRSLLQQFEDGLSSAETQTASGVYGRAQQQAFDLLTSSKLRSCFDLSGEDPHTVEPLWKDAVWSIVR